MRKQITIIFFLLTLSPFCVVQSLVDTMDPEDFWETASIVVVGTVEDVNTYSDNRGIYRIVEIEVEEYHIDVLNYSRVKIRAARGTLDNLTHMISTQVNFQVGQHVLVFLQAVKNPTEEYQYVPYAYWKFIVKGNTATRGRVSFEIPEPLKVLYRPPVKPPITFTKITTEPESPTLNDSENSVNNN